MKKNLIIMLGVFFAFGAIADDVTTITSKTYVDTEIAKKQDIVPAVNANTVLTHTDTAGVVGQKAIYNTTGTYAGQENALVTAGVADTAIQMAIDGEFVCANYPTCTLWQINSGAPSQLPNGYTQLEYIESTGTQYIDTGIAPTPDVGVSVKYSFQKLGAANYIFGTYDPHYYLGINTVGSHMVAAYGPWSGYTVAGFSIANVQPDEIFIFNMNYNNSKIAEFVGIESKQMQNTQFTSNDNTLTLFAIHSGSSAVTSYSSARIYYMKITNGTSLVRDFIPAQRNSDGKIGMYDLVTNTFFTNPGNRTLIAGPVAIYMPQNQ